MVRKWPWALESVNAQELPTIFACTLQGSSRRRETFCPSSLATIGFSAALKVLMSGHSPSCLIFVSTCCNTIKYRSSDIWQLLFPGTLHVGGIKCQNVFCQAQIKVLSKTCRIKKPVSSRKRHAKKEILLKMLLKESANPEFHCSVKSNAVFFELQFPLPISQQHFQQNFFFCVSFP